MRNERLRFSFTKGLSSVCTVILTVALLTCAVIFAKAQNFPDIGIVNPGSYYFKLQGSLANTQYTATYGLNGGMRLTPNTQSWSFGNAVSVTSPSNGGFTVKTSSGNPSVKLVSPTNNRNYEMFSNGDGAWGVYDGVANQDRLYLTMDGKLGLGTKTPTDLLTLSQPMYGTFDNVQLRIDNPDPFKNDNIMDWAAIQLSTSGSPNNKKWTIYTDSYGDFGIMDPGFGSSRLFISKSGNVGIGVTYPGSQGGMEPSALLEVGRDNAANTNTKFIVHGGAKFNNDADTQHLTQVTINTNTRVTGAALTVGGPAYIGSWNDAEGQVKAEYLQKYYLWVKQGVVSEDFAVAKIDTWKDEVFKDGYQLPTLHEIEQFVSQYKHLPGIPSEAEVKERGYTVNQITQAFLEKIEHLTLYAIDQEKKIKTLETQLQRYSHLQAEMEALKVTLKK